MKKGQISCYLITLFMLFLLFSCTVKKDDNKQDINKQTIPSFDDVFIDNSDISTNLPPALNDEILNDLITSSGNNELIYARKDEVKEVMIKLNNPSKYEIISFVINDIKYTNYQFKTSSNYEEIYFDLTVPSISGVYEYVISEIKYIDNETIKNVTIDKTSVFRIGVMYEDIPVTCVVSDYISSDDSYSFSVFLNLPQIYPSDGIYRFYLLKDGKIIKKESLSEGENKFNYNDLLHDVSYNVIVASNIDLLDGGNNNTHILYDEVFKTRELIKLDLKATCTSISLDIIQEEGVCITSCSLFCGDIKVDENTNNYFFDDLMSSTKYSLVITYSYKGKNYVKKADIATLEKVAPTINLSYNVTHNIISGSLDLLDLDNTLTYYEVLLYNNDVLIDSSKENDFSFNVNSNTLYKLVLKYSYNLGSSDEIITSTSCYDVKSLKQVPSFDIVIISITDDSLTYKIDILDENSTGRLKYVKISNDSFEKELSDIIGSISNLVSNTNYTLTACYTYDLNDGNGYFDIIKTMEFKTLQKEPDVVIDTLDISYNSFDLRVNITDVDKTLKYVKTVIYENNLYLYELNDLNVLSFTMLKTNTLYNLEFHFDKEINGELSSVIYRYSVKTLDALVSKIIYSYDATENSVTINIDKTNDLNGFKVISVEIYKDQDLINKIDNQKEVKFDNLTPVTNYLIKCIYQYILDNNVIKNESYEFNASTKEELITITSYEILTDGDLYTDSLIRVKCNIINNNKILFDQVVVNNKITDVIDTDNYSYVIFDLLTPPIDDLYQIVFNGVIYDNVKLIKTNELIFDNIKLTNKLSIIDIFEISYNKYGYIGDISTFVIKVNNPLDVLLTKISLYVNGKPLFVSLQKINDEYYMFNYENIDLGRMSIKVNELFYLEEDDTNKINSNYESVLNYVVLSSINKEYLEPTIINTKEELMNIDKYGSYILGCSIDMEEEEFKFDDFYGYFNGNGYSIKNLKIEDEECKIFNNINGVVENIYFENILFNVLCNDIVKTNLIYNKLNGSISNIYLSGVINTFGLNVEVITNDALTIVDKLIINGNDIFYPKKISSELFNDIDVKNELFNKTEENLSKVNDVDYNYLVIDDSYIIIDKVNLNDSFCIIPSMIGDLPVIGINSINNDMIEKLIISENILYLKQGALNNLISLQNLIFDNGDIILNDLITYFDMINVTNNEVVYNNVSYYLPNYFTYLSVSLKNNECVNLSNMITVEELKLVGFKKIMNDTLSNNSNLISITIDDSLLFSEADSFSSCSKLVDVYYNGDIFSYLNIDYENEYSNPMIFGTNFYLNDILLEELNLKCERVYKYQFISHEELVYLNLDVNSSIDESAFKMCTSVLSINISGSITTIKDSAFYCLESVEEVKLSDSIKTIGEKAFMYCSNLKNINMPCEILEIKDYAFNKCYSLTSITLPNKIESIGDSAFSNTYLRHELLLPDSLKYIGDSAFYGAEITKFIIYANSVPVTFAKNWNLSKTSVEYHPCKVNNLTYEIIDGVAYATSFTGEIFCYLPEFIIENGISYPLVLNKPIFLYSNIELIILEEVRQLQPYCDEWANRINGDVISHAKGAMLITVTDRYYQIVTEDFTYGLTI